MVERKKEGASRFQLFANPCTIAQQAPLSMGFPRQEYRSGFPLPSPGGLLDLGIELVSPALQADSLPTELLGKPSSVAWSYPILWDTMDFGMPDHPILHCFLAAATAAKSLQLCPTLCDPRDGSPPGSPGILQARTLEWVAIAFSNA